MAIFEKLMRCKNILLLLFLFLAFVTKSIYSAETNSCPSVASCSKTDVKCWEELYNNCNKDVNTLSSQLNRLDAQISINEVNIEQTVIKINQLEDEIASISARIDRLEGSLSTVINVLISRIIATYKTNNTGFLPLLFSSRGISDFLVKAKYIKVVQEHDKRLLFQMQETKNNYVEQKEEREMKKKEQTALKQQLAIQQANLSQSKKDKETLLSVTKNNAEKYHELLQEAQAELAALEKIKAGGGNAVSVGKVKAGDTVGFMINGKSPCSSGTHLHFEVQKDGSVLDPSGFLKNVSYVYDYDTSQFSDRISPSGSWNWPVNDNILIEQPYGMTYWARLGWYSGGPHTGIDMYSDSSLSVKSVEDGELYRGSIACGGGQLQFARVDQADNIQTYYLHITP